MPDPTPDPEEAAQRLRAIAGELNVAGLDAHVHETNESAYLTATTRANGEWREMEAVVDDDSYIELRFWANPGASPAQVSAVITRAMATITAAQRA